MPVFEFYHLTRSLSNTLILFLSHFWRFSLLTTFCGVFIDILDMQTNATYLSCIRSASWRHSAHSMLLFPAWFIASVSLPPCRLDEVLTWTLWFWYIFFKKWHMPKQKAERRAFMKSWGIVPYFLCLNCSLLCACSWYLTSGKPLDVYRVYTYSAYRPTLCLSIT